MKAPVVTKRIKSQYKRNVNANVDYLYDVKGKGEKLLCHGTVNLLYETKQEQIQEVKNRQKKYYGKARTFEHYIISFDSVEQVKNYSEMDYLQDVETFMQKHGYEENAVFYSVHKNTDNIHIHIAVDKINPITFEVTDTRGIVQFNSKKYGKRVHDALCCQAVNSAICEKRGWDSSAYSVNAQGKSKGKRKQATIRLSNKTIAEEQRTGTISDERKCLELCEKIFSTATNWQESISALKKEGIVYEIRKTGAVIKFNKKRYKNSQLGDKNHFKNLVLRFGEFPSVENVKNVKNVENVKPIQKSRKEILQEKLKKKPNETRSEWAKRNLEHYNSFPKKNDYVLRQIAFFEGILAESAYFMEKRKTQKDLTTFCRQTRYKKHSVEEIRLGFDLIALEISVKHAENYKELEKIKVSYQNLLKNNPSQSILIQNQLNFLEKQIFLQKHKEADEVLRKAVPPKVSMAQILRNNAEEDAQRAYYASKNSIFAKMKNLGLLIEDEPPTVTPKQTEPPKPVQKVQIQQVQATPTYKPSNLPRM